jgi:NAD(P)H dehydrogenase (quinone)
VLLDEGFAVRAFVHNADERSDKLKARGAEIVVGDLLELGDARSALKDVNAPYFAEAAEDASLNSVANMSQISARCALPCWDPGAMVRRRLRSTV